MPNIDSVVAVFIDHQAAEDAIKKLAQDGYEMKDLSVIGKGCHTEETIIGFYNAGDRIKFWGARGAFWGGLWGLFFGGLVASVPVIGNVVALGYLTSAIVAAIDSAVVVGAFSALGAALYSIGIPKDSILQYEQAVKADGFLVMVHGSSDEVARAKTILSAVSPSEIALHMCERVAVEQA